MQLLVLLCTFFLSFPIFADLTEDLLRAVGRGNQRQLEHLLSIGADIHAGEYKTGLSALHIATRTGNQSMVEFLLKKGADPNLKDKDFGFTPVQVATYCGHLSILKILHENSGNLNILDNKKQNSPIHIAAERNFYEIVRYLLSQGVDANIKDEKGKFFYEKLSPYNREHYQNTLVATSKEALDKNCKDLLLSFNDLGISGQDFSLSTQAKFFEDWYSRYGNHANFNECLYMGMGQDVEKYYWTSVFLFDEEHTSIKNFSLAKEILTKGIAMNKQQSTLVALHYILGLLFWRENSLKQAKIYFKKAYQLSVKFPGAIPALTKEEKVAIDKFMGNTMQ